MSLVLDLRITHDRFGSRSDPDLNGHLHYPNNVDRSLNETVTDKIRKYHPDYNNNPPHVISFIPVIPSTSGRLHSEFVRLLFLQDHRETDLFFASSGVQLVQPTSDQFHFRRSTFSTHLRAKIDNIVTKTATLRRRTYRVTITHSPITPVMPCKEGYFVIQRAESHMGLADTHL